MEPADPILRKVVSSSARYQSYYDKNQHSMDLMAAKMRERNWPDEMTELALKSLLNQATE